jgi:diguanylate cyclase (GGDEF)-like protein/PAS domain S-box-containing protein
LGQETERLQTLVEELQQAHAELRDSHARFERIARTIPCVLYDFITEPDGKNRFLYLSPRCQEFFEVSAEDIVKRPSIFWKMLHPDDLPGLMKENWRTNNSRELFVAEARIITPSGKTKWIRFSSLPSAAEVGKTPVWSGFMFDVTERKQMEEEVQRLATTDALTGVSNRRHFLQQAEAELERFRRSGVVAALLMIDLDHFKKINDGFGHAAGDAVLKHFSELIKHNLRHTDSFGRLGGEEFAVLLPSSRLAGAMELAARMCQIVVSAATEFDARTIPITISIGVTEFLQDDAGIESVMARADQALYKAKQTGRNRVVVY